MAEDDLTPHAPVHCAVCDRPATERYCAGCGERHPSPDDERLGPFLRDQFHEVTSADGKLWRTVRALFTPGRLTTEFFAGRRGLYVRPVRIFLVANVLFFLMLTAIGANSSFQGRASTQRASGWYGPWATARLAEATDRAGVPPEVYDAAFDQKSNTLATSLVGLVVPLLALVFAAALVWRRVSGVRHLVFATHYIAFAMAGSMVVAFVWLPVVTLVRALDLLAPDHWLTYSMDPVIGVVLLVYLAFALRRVYTLGWAQTMAVTAGVSVVGVPLVVKAYQLVLFVVALWTTKLPTV